MGWKLAEEVAWARPEQPGPEWWTLLDLAQDARDETRQGMPGHEYLAARAKCSRRTVYRRLKTLTEAGLITLAQASAPGRRAIYEVGVLHITGDTNAGTRQQVPSPGQQVTENGQRVPRTLSTPPSIPPSIPPSSMSLPLTQPCVEGSGNGQISDGFDFFTRAGTDQARRAQAEALRQWELGQPGAAS